VGGGGLVRHEVWLERHVVRLLQLVRRLMRPERLATRLKR
jgi:hypothetical protein